MKNCPICKKQELEIHYNVHNDSITKECSKCGYLTTNRDEQEC